VVLWDTSKGRSEIPGKWCWRTIEKINWTVRVRNEEVLHRVNAERNTLHTRNRRKTNLIGHIWRMNCLLKHVVGGKIGVRGTRGRRCTQLLNDLKEKRGYWKLKEGARDRTFWRTRFGKGYGPVIRQTTE